MKSFWKNLTKAAILLTFAAAGLGTLGHGAQDAVDGTIRFLLMGFIDLVAGIVKATFHF